MDLNRVSIFLRVVDDGGFTAAARALGLPKSSVSRGVALLEQELGVRLLQRSTRAVTTTEAGAAFYERASRGIAALEEAAAAVAEMESAVRGRIRVTAAVDVGAWMLAPIAGAFAGLYPEVHLEVVLTGRVVDLVEEGFDLAVRAGPLRDESLIAKKLPSVEAALYASPEYLERHGAPRRVADLSRHRAVLFRPSGGRATWTLEGPSGESSVEVAGAIGADDYAFLVEAVRAGAGIGLLPSAFIGRVGLARVLPRHSVPGAPMHIVYPSARYLPHRVALFRDFLLERWGRR